MAQPMYELARNVKINNVTIPKGTRLSDVYQSGLDGDWFAIAHPSIGGRIKLTLRPEDIRPATDSK